MKLTPHSHLNYINFAVVLWSLDCLLISDIINLVVLKKLTNYWLCFTFLSLLSFLDFNFEYIFKIVRGRPVQENIALLVHYEYSSASSRLFNKNTSRALSDFRARPEFPVRTGYHIVRS